MSDTKDLQPDLAYIKSNIHNLRNPNVVYGNTMKSRLESELTLLDVATQKSLQETLERSIISQDKLAVIQNKLAYRSMWVAIAEVIVGIGAFALALVSYLLTFG